MSIISVNAKELGQELDAWGVPHNYAILFLEKSTVKNGRVALHPFFFNDTEHMTNKRHWLKELAEQTASHTHSNTGAPTNAGAIRNTGTKADTLNGKYSPLIGK